MFSLSKIGAAACDNDEIQLSTGFTHKDDWQGRTNAFKGRTQDPIDVTTSSE